jgi:hypothetical protein
MIQAIGVGIKSNEIMLRIKINICQAIVISRNDLDFSQIFCRIDLRRKIEIIEKVPPNAQE